MKSALYYLTAIIFTSCATGEAVKPVPGFQIVHSVDRSRIYKSGTDTSDYLHFRPIDIDLWYPSSIESADTVLRFRDLLGLLEKRANYLAGHRIGDGITQQLAQNFCDIFKCSDTSRLLDYKSSTYRNSKPIPAKFPLVIYLTSFNGMSFENYKLFEDLSRNGFVVASISSIGRFPGDMTMKKEDLMEQVNDAIATIKALETNGHIDFSKIGIVGYSWGGLAGSMLADKVENVKCIVSLDGSEFHHYGSAKEENHDFDDIRNSPDFKNLRISVPYLRLQSAADPGVTKHDSIYNFTEKLSSNFQILEVDSAKHQDFGYLPTLATASGNCESKPVFRRISSLTVSFLKDHLKDMQSFDQNLNEEITKGTVHRK